MPFQALQIELTGPVATIWMNRPDLHNAFDEILIAELTAACIALDEDDDIRVVILAGRGKSFSAGADLNWMKRAANNGLDDNLNDARALARMLRTLAEMQKPTIARIQGAALGGGMGLAAACDIAVASTKAVFATSEVKFGIIPSAISALRAARHRPPSGQPLLPVGRTHRRHPCPRNRLSSTKSSSRKNWMPRCRKSSAPCSRAARSPKPLPRTDPRRR
jgi:enoyl-CoA hydratase/carnithine racemase